MYESEIPTKVKNKTLVEKRRKQIVLAAIKLFAKNGFHKTNMRDLAEESGISHGNIYDYVGNKQDILFLIHQFINSMALDEIKRNTKNVVDPLEKLRCLVRSEFNLMNEQSDAILLLYQETHILDKHLLKALLHRERTRVAKIETVLEECFQKGFLRKFNKRVGADLIKAMTESWVAKRWDLRGHVDGSEMEKAILDIVFNGLLVEKNSAASKVWEADGLQSKNCLIINGDTILSKAIAIYLISKGVNVAIHTDRELIEEREYPTSGRKEWEKARVYLAKKYGPFNKALYNRILEDCGSINIIIHDTGISTKNIRSNQKNVIASSHYLQENLDCAQDFAGWIEQQASSTALNRILYLTPWAWDGYSDQIRYRAARASIKDLSINLANRVAKANLCVNCIVPGFIGGVRPLDIEKKKSMEVADRVPMGRAGDISDVLEAVRFLISDHSRYITGQVLNVSGGMD